MKRTHTLRARTERYKDRQTGQERQGYMTVGHVLEKPDGSVMLKLDSLPVNFDGWMFYGELPEKRLHKDAAQGKEAAANQQADMSDDIPF